MGCTARRGVLSASSSQGAFIVAVLHAQLLLEKSSTVRGGRGFFASVWREVLFQANFAIATSGLQAFNGEVKSVRRCVVNSRKIAVVAVLCAVTALVACRREEVVPLKLGGPVAEQPAR